MGYALSCVGASVSESEIRAQANSTSQLRLPFPDSIRGFEDLAITKANQNAIATIRKWRDWQMPALCLVGPVQCGLGLIAKLWAREAGAVMVAGPQFDRLSLGEIETLTESNCVVDLADDVGNEEHFLALLNRTRAKDKRLLLTARSTGATWPCQSLDLKSRLETLPVAEIYPPDEEMIEARLRASCKRQYIKLSDGAIKYLTIRLPRSYEAIEDYVSRLDKAIDETGRAPGMNLARSVLEDGASTRKLFEDEQD